MEILRYSPARVGQTGIIRIMLTETRVAVYLPNGIKTKGRDLPEWILLFFGFPLIKSNSSEIQALSTHQTIKQALV